MSGAPAGGVDVAHVLPRAGALSRTRTLGGAGFSNTQVRAMFIAPPQPHAVVALRWAHAISELTGPFWAACREGGSISELKGVFSLFTSEMSSETAT